MLSKKKKVLIIVLTVITGLTVIMGIYFDWENNTLQVTKYQIQKANLPVVFDGFKIAHISDFHNTNSSRLQKSLINQMQKQQPDIVVITGDLIDARRTDTQVALNFVQRVQELVPVYYVPGNHEANIAEYQSFKNQLVESGVVVLGNQAVEIERAGQKISLLGINDPAMAHDKYVDDGVIVKNEIEGLTYDQNNFSVLLSHRPELLSVYAEEQVDLVFSGHAHGGQIRIPLIGGVVAPNQGLFPKITAGTFTENRTTMVVSRGIGNSVLPFRINNNPELVIATLQNI